MKPLRTTLGGIALGGALLLGGAAGAYAVTGSAGAQDNTSTTVAASTDPSAAAPADAPSDGAGDHGGANGGHVANGITEAPLTGDDLAKATAAAEAAVSGGTVDRAETDAEGAAFEVHMTTADGERVTVKLDSDFKVTSTEDGMR